MKFFSTVIVSFCVIGLIIGVTPIKADAGDGGKKSIRRGDFCWDFTSTLGNSGTLQLGVTHIGDDHNLCSGFFTVTSEGGIIFPAYGNLEIVGEDVYLTLSLAGVRNGVIGIDMIKATLDSDLDGSFESIGVYSVDGNTGSSAVVELSSGTLTSTTCE
jgi:hypothetical protein